MPGTETSLDNDCGGDEGGFSYDEDAQLPGVGTPSCCFPG